eukprot:TRINITY_DN2483_c0_g1_i1.p2 TRINITY_DN2483_c0_g1~~TRINITY_DN2483_c0_g1_i1.p2  ORF type:complete len:281 (+),score=40.24 TRINITY_DN2483_c0_g1_i1:555-1397(+)
MAESERARLPSLNGEGSELRVEEGDSRRCSFSNTLRGLRDVHRRMRGPSIWKKVIAEFLGLFTIIIVGCGCVVVDKVRGGGLSIEGVAMTWGAVVMVMIYAIGHISGAHFNPAVTIAFGIFDHFPKKHIPFYVAAQCAAAIVASKVLELTLGNVAELGSTIPSGSDAQSLAMEILATAFLMFVIAAVATDSRAEGTMAGIAIGGAILFDVLFAGPISGASMNPARTLGPAIISGQYKGLWLYFVGPILGAAAGILAYEVIRCCREEEDAYRTGAHGCCKL